MSWRKYQKRIRLRRGLRKLAVVVSGVILLILAAALYRGYRWLSTRPESVQFSFGAISWDGKNQLNLWLPANGLVVALDPQEESLRYLPVESQEEIRRKIKVPLDGYLLFPEGNLGLPTERFLLKLGLRTFLTARSNLSRGQLIGLWWHWRRVNPNNLSLSSDFSERAIKEERLKIIVLNGSDIAGLAARAAERIEALGGEVIMVGNANGSSEASKNVIQSYNVSPQSRTIQRLRQLLNAKVEFVQVDKPKRADVVVTLSGLF